MDPPELRESPAGLGGPSVGENVGDDRTEVNDNDREADGESEETEETELENKNCHEENMVNGQLTEEELDPRIQVN